MPDLLPMTVDLSAGATAGLLGVTVVESDTLERNQILTFADPLPSTVYVHPLAFIELEAGDDLGRRLDRTLAWLVARARRRLDAAAPKSGDPQ